VSYQRILLDKTGDVATLTPNRPEKHNALDMLLFQEFGRCMEALDEDEDTRAIVITGAGRSFCSGIDLMSLADLATYPASLGSARAGLDQPYGPLQVMPDRLRACRKPTVAAINGFASGMGLSLACLCDQRIASEQATFAPGFVNIGLAGELGLTYLLPRITSLPVALQFLAMGETKDAGWAEGVGLVAQVTPPEAMLESALQIAGRLAEMPPLALEMVKRLVYQGLNSDFDSHMQAETFAASLLVQSEDCREAMTARLEKRPPVFKGR